MSDSEEPLNKLRRFLLDDDGCLEQQIQLAGLYLLAWEMLQTAIREHLETFFSDISSESGQIEFKVQEKYTHLFSGTKQFEMQLAQWKEWEVLSDEETDLIQELRKYRNEIAHRITRILINDHTPMIEIGHIEAILSLIHKIDHWWLENFEAAINPHILTISEQGLAEAYSWRVGFLSQVVNKVNKSRNAIPQTKDSSQ
ncbi:MAG: hypothetical protein HQL56_00135 [Magnetococcales bacterium]|nr:hypothetical protein [Magnetococcales bacterium]